MPVWPKYELGRTWRALASGPPDARELIELTRVTATLIAYGADEAGASGL
jgi:hypothetical protein